MENSLFLEGVLESTPNGQCLHLPAKSVIILFSLQASCSKLPVDVVLVNTKFSEANQSSPKTSSVTTQVQFRNGEITSGYNGIPKDTAKVPNDYDENIFTVPLDALMFELSVKRKDDCPLMIQQSDLPAVLCPSEHWCVAGLSAALRYILKLAVDVNNDEMSRKLLGFRLGCLQSCSEVSCWTKFCEIEVPDALQDTYMNLNIDDYTKPYSLTFPSTILRFNNHLSKPLILHNALKKKQAYIRKTVKDKEEREALLAKKCHELPELEHCYAEGLDMTIADVILYVSFSLVTTKLKNISFSSISPLVVKWIKLLTEEECIARALPLLRKIQASSSNAMSIEMNVTIPEIGDESLYKSDPERSRVDASGRMTIQEDIDRVTSQLAAVGVNVEYSENPTEEELRLPWSTYPGAVNPQEGNLPAKRLERKCQQLENMVCSVAKLCKPASRVVDFCAGGGHVALLLAYRLPQCTFIMVENKASSLERAKARAKDLNLLNVEFYQCNLDYFVGGFDVGVCLHACGQATDMVLQKCFDQRASFVCSPCCYGSIRPNPKLVYPRCNLYQETLPHLLDYLTLCHSADQTHGPDHPSTAQGQLCMRLVDGDRLQHARQLGYSTHLLLMSPATCSPKNHILVGIL